VAKPIRITIYNHKGGVGKTTLAINIAAALSELGKSVLLVDTDPQCNLTSYLLSDDVVDNLLDHSDGPGGQTIWTAVKPVFDRVGDVQFVAPKHIGDLALLPGDIRLSEFEEFLAEAWTDSFRRRLGGLRASTAIRDLVSQISSQRQFDYVFYDAGPNIGPLNRVLVLDSDYFIVPVACDLFSVRALSTLGETLKRWLLDAQTIASLAPDATSCLPAAPRFLGYIPQRFKTYGQTMSQESSQYLRQVKKRVYENISAVLRSIDPGLAPEASVDPVIGQVKDFASLVQISQREGVPLWKCSSTYQDQKDAAHVAFRQIAQHISNAPSASATRRSPRR